jgi:predicted nucleic acid-binding protein
MAFVVDASAAVSWILPDENDATARAAHLRLLEGEQAVAPVQWWFEVRNVLLVAERRGRVTPEETD